jgi:hypothetical protein
LHASTSSVLIVRDGGVPKVRQQVVADDVWCSR